MSSDHKSPTQLSTSAINKLVLFIVLIIPPVIFVVGIVPILLLVYGLTMALAREDFKQVNLSIRNCNYFLFTLALLGGGGLFIAGIVNGVRYYYEYYNESSRVLMALGRDATLGVCGSGIAIILLSVVYKKIIQHLYLEPLTENKEWLMSLKMPSFRSRPKKIGDRGFRVVVDKPLASAQVIEDISRWEKLKDEGRITELEFDEIRIKILQRI